MIFKSAYTYVMMNHINVPSF